MRINAGPDGDKNQSKEKEKAPYTGRASVCRAGTAGLAGICLCQKCCRERDDRTPNGHGDGAAHRRRDDDGGL